MSWFRPCLHEALCKTVKWHRVPVLSRRWWISVHHVEQAVHDYPTHVDVVALRDCMLKRSFGTFEIVRNGTESVVMKPSSVNLSCC